MLFCCFESLGDREAIGRWGDQDSSGRNSRPSVITHFSPLLAIPKVL
ncbi:hypothetical protein H6F46_10685 [Limnothrix sp. FACHB-1083]|nr:MULTISPECIES: hypothetical protein [unclassified Limnothrix]MBD2161158.1 hypothetical protein [Limnothrix sp. FACHB-1083]MBD2192479.1 hypothetical protein [Limnothrix sp. FACHB-1088]